VSRDPVQALERFQEAIRLNPGLAEAHNGAGNLIARLLLGWTCAVSRSIWNVGGPGCRILPLVKNDRECF
jgi:hypothetical protein